MRRLLIVLVLVPVALASAGDPVKSRWRSLTSGNLFEVTDYGDRLSVRFLEAEVVADQSTERPDAAVTLNSPKEQLRPGRWLLQKGPDGKYVGTRNEEIQCTYWRQWNLEWRTQVCNFSNPVEMYVTAAEITGRSEGKPATGSHFECGKCKWSKTEKYEFQWAREDASRPNQQATSAPSAAVTSGGTASSPASTEGRGVFAIESTPPGAEVYVDGEFVGTTPMAEHGLTTGKHEIELRKKGFATWKRQLSVSAGARATVAAEMEP
jgi:hypothetical protein